MKKIETYSIFKNSDLQATGYTKKQSVSYLEKLRTKAIESGDRSVMAWGIGENMNLVTKDNIYRIERV